MKGNLLNNRNAKRELDAKILLGMKAVSKGYEVNKKVDCMRRYILSNQGFF